MHSLLSFEVEFLFLKIIGYTLDNKRFICEYDMSWYPFDTQTCHMDFKLEENMNNEGPQPPKWAKTEETKTLRRKKVIQSEVWAEFVTFSRNNLPTS